MKTFETKNISGGILDVDDKSRRVKVILNRTGIKDFDGDVIERTAFDKTIRERGPRGKGLVWHLTDHNPSLTTAIARFSELYMNGHDLVGVTDIPNTTIGNDSFILYKTGNINQHSIGFKTEQKAEGKDSEGGYVIIKEVKLFEGSAVLWGANEWTSTISVGKSEAMQEITRLSALLGRGELSEERQELMKIKMEQLKSFAYSGSGDDELDTFTQVVRNYSKQLRQEIEERTPEGQMKALCQVINQFTQSLKARI